MPGAWRRSRAGDISARYFAAYRHLVRDGQPKKRLCDTQPRGTTQQGVLYLAL